jgi:hypothetical protein
LSCEIESGTTGFGAARGSGVGTDTWVSSDEGGTSGAVVCPCAADAFNRSAAMTAATGTLAVTSMRRRTAQAGPSRKVRDPAFPVI